MQYRRDQYRRDEIVEKYDKGERDFAGMNLRYVNLADMNLSDANFRGAYLTGTGFYRSILLRTNFQEAELDETDFSYASLQQANFQDADLSKANFVKANLHQVDFRGANLREAEFALAQMKDVKGLLDKQEWLDRRFQQDELGYIVYKVFHLHYPPNPFWKIKEGSIIAEEGTDWSPQQLCSTGINVATLAWITDSQNNFYRKQIWKCRIHHEWLEDVVVPYGTDGKFRTRKLEILERLPVVEW